MRAPGFNLPKEFHTLGAGFNPVVAHRAEQALQRLHRYRRLRQRTGGQALQSFVVLLPHVRFDVGRKPQFHGFARHGDVAVRCAQLVLGFGTFVVGLHQLASVFRRDGLQHQEIEPFFLLDGSVRTLHGVALGVRHRETKFGVGVIRVLDRESIQRGILAQLFQLFDAFVQAGEVGFKRGSVHRGYWFLALREGVRHCGQNVLVDTVLRPNASFCERRNLNQGDAQLVAQNLLLGIPLRCLLVIGVFGIPMAGMALVLEGQSFFFAVTIELPCEFGAVVLGQENIARAGEIPFEKMLQDLTAQRLAYFPLVGRPASTHHVGIVGGEDVVGGVAEFVLGGAALPGSGHQLPATAFRHFLHGFEVLTRTFFAGRKRRRHFGANGCWVGARCRRRCRLCVHSTIIPRSNRQPRAFGQTTW